MDRCRKTLPAWAGCLAAVAALLAVPGAVRADDCAPVMAAFEAQASAPTLSQTMTMQGRKMRSIFIGDTLYAEMEGAWKTVQMKPGGRLGMMRGMLGMAGGLSECADLGTETLDGSKVRVLSYRPPAFPGAGPSGLQKIWVGVDDGLPHRLVGEEEGLDAAFAYKDVKAPVP